MNNKKLPCYAVLLIITLAAGLILGATYTLTKQPIDAQQALSQENARKAVLPAADAFEALETPEGLDWLYSGSCGGEFVGYAAQITTSGFGGEIEIVIVVDADGTLGGISVGGSNFSETAGLGAKSKDASFTDQFAGKTYPLNVVKAGEEKTDSSIDAITSATITSRAVTNAVNTAVEIIMGGSAE